MPKKTSSSKTEQVATPAPVVDAVETKPKVKSTKPKKSVVEVPTLAIEVTVSTPAPAPVELVVAEVSAAEPDTPKLSADFFTKLQAMSGMISALKTEYRALEKTWSRQVKSAQKMSSKRKRKAGNRAPSGFVKPTKISDELASFLGKEIGSEMARTEVTRSINTYIRANSLQNKENGRKIIPDAKLSALLKLKTTDELTYFNLQRYMSPHFAKANKAVAV
jgi:chromatin remodeling complex protein RSC6